MYARLERFQTDYEGGEEYGSRRLSEMGDGKMVLKDVKKAPSDKTFETESHMLEFNSLVSFVGNPENFWKPGNAGYFDIAEITIHIKHV